MPAGNYVVTATITDDDGGKGSATTIVGVDNVAPSALSLGLTSPIINEGSSTTLNASFTDPGTLDNHNAVITWGDGTSSSISLAAGVLSFSASHTYANDSATSYPIGVLP